MGLDMYLNARRYISPYSYDEKSRSEQSVGTDIAKLIGLDASSIGGDSSSEAGRVVGVEIRLMYWRKANAIHGWFVREVQESEDDCKEHLVIRDKLVELRDLCALAIANQDPSLLPPQNGFFFGSQEADDWYWDGLERTKSQLTKIIDNLGSEWDVYYQSSW